MKKSIFKNSYFIYTVTFLILLPFVFLPFIIEGKTFIWHLDGISQHYPMLQYYGKLLRGILSGKGFPLFDFKLGLGFDTITTLHYYVLGDPISLLSIFMNERNGAFVYGALILFRFYLVGISFILLMRYWKQDGLKAVLGALIYVFCGYSFFAGERHPFFLNPMIYLPIIIIGLEQVLRRKKPYLLIIITFISTISNFYFLYVLTMMAIGYVIFRYVTVYRKKDKNFITGFLVTGFKTGGYYLLGVAMGAFLLLPVINAFLHNGRMSDKPHLVTGLFYYPLKYYVETAQSVFAVTFPSYWVTLSLSSITLVSFVILFLDKKYRQLSFILYITLCGLMIPAFGYFMNGFAYLANRWCFLFNLIAAVAFTVTYDKLCKLDRLEKMIIVFAVAFYGIISNTKVVSKAGRYEFYVMILVVLVIMALQLPWIMNRKRLQDAAIYFVVLLTLIFHGYAMNSPNFYGYVDQFLSKSKIEKLTTKGELSIVSHIKDKSFYRIDSYGNSTLNESLLLGFHDVSAYFSLMNGDVTSYLKAFEVVNQRSAYRFDNMDNRTILNELSGVKYFITTNKSAVPYGYTLVNTFYKGTKECYLFVNNYPLSLGYMYSNYILTDNFNKLSALEKQNAMMSAIVLDTDSNYAQKADANFNTGIEKREFTIAPDQNVILTENKIKVRKGGAVITLHFQAIPQTETYVRLSGLNIIKKLGISTTFLAQGENEARKMVNVRNIYYNSYFGKQNYLINIGYSKIGVGSVTLTFPEKHTYSYKDLEVYSVYRDNYKIQAAALAKSPLKNIKVGNNNIKGDINSEQKGIMALSIPYSKGWIAYVDGVKTELLPSNIMYMALPLEAGEHQISLTYATPFLKEGCLVSLAAFLVFIGIVTLDRRRNKKQVID